MKTKKFNSFEAYEAWTEQFDNCEYCYIPAIIDDGWKISMDMFTDCKSWKTALNRFKKAFGDYNEDVKAWIDGLYESYECGYTHDECTYATKELEKERSRYGTFSWGIEEVDEGRWYIFMNLSGSYAGYQSKVA